MTAWYAFRIAPQKEQKAHKLLTERGFASLFAHELHQARTHRHKRHATVDCIRPLLHGYALLRDDGERDWLARCFSVEWPLTHGRVLKAVIGANNRAQPIPQASIDWLASMSGQTKPLPQVKPVAVGTYARITRGPFAGFQAPVEAIQGKQAQLLLGIFGTLPRPVTVQLDHLEAA